MRWTHLTPPDFRKAAEETGLLIIPMGSLERHGEHLPFGTDAIIAETTCLRAAETEPAVVFPVWHFGQVHEAAIFTGSINFPAEMLIQMLKIILKEAAANGFRKILIYSAHGGNSHMLEYLDMATMDEHRDYSLYIIKGDWALFNQEERAAWNSILDTKITGHACEAETSMVMDCAPEAVKMEYQRFSEPVEPLKRTSHLDGIYTSFWWYADYPENVVGTPSAATPEKGAKLMNVKVKAFVRAVKAIKADTAVPELQKEFIERKNNKGT
jgi:creatinine amidohydrolase